MANNPDKMEELILYVAQKSIHDPSFGSIKMNKILFYSDFYSYIQTGESITGRSYHKRQFGPCPTALKPTLQKMEDAQRIYRYEHPAERGNRTRKQVLPKDHANLSCFSPEEIDVINSVIGTFRDHTAMELSEISHMHRSWQLAEEGEEIPYFTVHIADRQPQLSKAQMQWAESVVAAA